MSANRKNFFLRMLDPSLILGGMCTIGFYAVIHHPSMHDSVLHHYTTEHVVEYVIVTLWIWGVVDILLRMLSFPRDLLALRENWLPPRQGKEPASHALAMLENIRSRPRWLRESRVGKRLSSALEYVVQKGSAEDFREHLHYLAAQDEDITYSNYTLPRFIIAVTPVLGFLGTVVHFGTALSGISFDEMAEKLPVVVGEMGQAFNTTTTALAAAMSMMFALFLCERIEKGYVHQIDRLSDRELMNRFEIKDGNLTPFLAALKSANDEALAMIANTLGRHTELWIQAFDGVLSKFDARQQQDTQAWNTALTALNARHESLETQRIAAHKQHADEWKQALQDLSVRHEEFDAVREGRLLQMVETLDGRQSKLLSHVDSTLERALMLRDGVGELVEALHGIHQGEGKLLEVQTVLAKNLRVIHETQKIDDALHGLTAAIHLLTARNRGDMGHSAAA
ncbi:MotA/TolQ/ExbB proton channel family protein [Planctomicrobium piriforme]|uniref:Biopolymer transport protein ExbB/TolQ n=1 Tax=Planctomicrobium piriforme TaxID=1576369 RepID=A0A1I3HQ40_9PLAN|nr:MotA/TolQ/ExbB proton channel family protein [Planctomicrobium piriforme]SFI37876.1 Biopolymer transport protein ExbB/TolQ [Planctomicrobium piriforme]